MAESNPLVDETQRLTSSFVDACLLVVLENNGLQRLSSRGRSLVVGLGDSQLYALPTEAILKQSFRLRLPEQ